MSQEGKIASRPAKSKKEREFATGGKLPSGTVPQNNHKKHPQIKNSGTPIFKLELTPGASLVAAVIVTLVGVGVSLGFLFFAHTLNGSYGFPLDDAWIHLTFARTFAETGRFAYYAGGPVTAGSTSPLFTLLESVFWFFSHNEFIIGYSLGILFFAGTIFFSYLLLKKLYQEEQWIPMLAALSIALEPRLLAISLSGMETTLVTCLMLACAYCYQRRLVTATGVFAGLLVWARPDTVIFLAALGLQYLYDRKKDNNEFFGKERLIRLTVVTGVLVGLYALFNLILSGSLLPNTFSAKLAYYKHGNATYLKELWTFFASKWYIAAFLLYGAHLLHTLKAVISGERTPWLYAHLYILGLAAVYWWKLPYLYQSGRYVIPILPFYLITALLGALSVRDILSGIIKSGKGLAMATVLLFAVVLVGEATSHRASKKEYADYSAYIGDLQVRTAEWCNKNVPKDAVIATHDIGALGFYAERPIVDVVGLITPEITPKIGDPVAAIELMKKYKVTHVAFLQNWFEITNIKPLYSSDPRVGELMQVFPFKPEMQIASEEELAIHKYARAAIAQGSFADALPALSEGFERNPKDPLTHTLAGLAQGGLQQFPAAESEFRQALALFPNDPNALTGLAKVKASMGQPDSSVTLLKQAVLEDSLNVEALTVLTRILNQLNSPDASIFANRLKQAEATVEANIPRVLKRKEY